MVNHPSVLEVAVFGTPDDKWGETPCAFVETSQEVDAAELLAFAKARLPKFARPKTAVVGERCTILHSVTLGGTPSASHVRSTSVVTRRVVDYDGVCAFDDDWLDVVVQTAFCTDALSIVPPPPIVGAQQWWRCVASGLACW